MLLLPRRRHLRLPSVSASVTLTPAGTRRHPLIGSGSRHNTSGESWLGLSAASAATAVLHLHVASLHTHRQLSDPEVDTQFSELHIWRLLLQLLGVVIKFVMLWQVFAAWCIAGR